MQRYVIYSEEAGVFVGSLLGFGFWSLWDPVGQDFAVTFPTVEAAWETVASWENRPADPLRCVAVECGTADDQGVYYATVSEIEAAGLPGWTPAELRSAR